MATPVSVTSSNTSGAAAQVQAKEDRPVSVAAKAKADLNASIVQASLTVSLNSSNDPMSVVLKTALTGINEALKDDFGDNAIQNAVSQDNTPEGTAGRIVSLSTAFFGAYKQQHPGEDEGELLNKFMDTIKSGVERGFKEARDVLQSLKALSGDISTNVDKTYELVQKGFDDFISTQQARIDGAREDAAGATSKADKAAA